MDEYRNNVASDKLVPITIRFSEGAYEAIEDVASECHTSMANIVRLAVDNRLAEYLGTIQYVNVEQGKDIAKQIACLQNTVSKMCSEVNRIGANYNQHLHRINAQRKIIEDLKKEKSKVLAEMEEEKNKIQVLVARDLKVTEIKAKTDEYDEKIKHEIHVYNCCMRSAEKAILGYQDAIPMMLNEVNDSFKKAGDALWHILE